MPSDQGGGPHFSGTRLDVAVANIAQLNLPPGVPISGSFAPWGGNQWDPTSSLNVATPSNPGGPAIGDARWVTDGAITTLLKAFTSATAAFTPADKGKILLIAGAGTAGVALQTTIAAYVSATQVTTADAAVLTVSGANACIGTDNSLPIQAAINQQQVKGGFVVIPAGNFLVGGSLVPAPGDPFVSGFTTSTRTCLIQGAGIGSTVLIAGAIIAAGGLIGYGRGNNPVTAQLILLDLTLDGNYSGVANGVFPQETVNQSALLSINAPFTNAASTAPNGRYNVCERVKLYRPSGYGVQGIHGHKFYDCEFESVGQPDLASGATHYDNLGSGAADCMVIGSTWKDSSGNYVDFVSTVGTDLIRVIFIGNVSRNHQIGGLYGCGNGSIICGNRLRNNVVGGGVGYDVGTVAGVKSKNQVFGNTLDNMTVNNSGLSYATFGDMVYANNSSDSTNLDSFAPIRAESGVNFGSGNASNNNTGQINSDGTNMFISATAVTGGNIYLRPVSGGQRGALVGNYNAGVTQWQTFDDSGVLRNTLDDGVGGMTFKGHLVSTATGTPVTSNLGANVTSATFTGNDTRGTIAIVMSAGLAANTRVFTATFAVSYGATAPKITLVDQTSTAGLAIVNSYVLAQSTGVSFDLAFDQALVAGTYTIDYIVIG